MNLALAVAAWMAIGLVDVLFKGRFVSSYKGNWSRAPKFWKDQGLLCWRGLVLFPLAVAAAWVLLLFVSPLSMVMFVLLFWMEHRAYWFWTFWITKQEQTFRTHFGSRADGTDIYGTQWRMQVWPWETPHKPAWLSLWGLSFAWLHDPTLNILVYGVLLLVEVFT
jgi:hypothetical protein